MAPMRVLLLFFLVLTSSCGRWPGC